MYDDSEDNSEAAAFHERMQHHHWRIGEALKVGLRRELRRAPMSTLMRNLSVDQQHYLQEAYDGGSVGMDLVHPIQNAVMDVSAALLVAHVGILCQHPPRVGDGQPSSFPPDMPCMDDPGLRRALLDWGVEVLVDHLTAAYRPEVRDLVGDGAWLEIAAWECLRPLPGLARTVTRHSVETLVATILSVKEYGRPWGEKPMTPREEKGVPST